MKPNRDSLTARQREVLELVAARKTNGEIAEDLGIALETAKVHVREILDVVGVDTREEAAEWWRQQHGLRARFAVGDRLSRMPALLKLGIGGAGAAAVAGVVALFAFLPASDDALDPGVWLAHSGPVHDTQIRLVQVDGDAPEQRIGKETHWETLAWSPTGRRLAGIALDWDARVVSAQVMDVQTGDVVAEVSGPAVRPPMSWSPDGRYVAFEPDLARESGGQLGILDTETGELAVVEPIARWEEDAVLDVGGAIAWAPDSSKLVYVNPEGLVFLRPGGSVIAVSPAEEWLADAGEPTRPAGIRNYEWEAAGEFRIYLDAGIGSPGQARVWTATATVTDGDVTWSGAERVRRSDVPRGPEPPCREIQERLDAAHGPFGTWYGDPARWCEQGIAATTVSTSDDKYQPEDLTALVVDGEEVVRVQLDPPDTAVEGQFWSLATDAARIE